MPTLERAQLVDAAKAVLARNWTGHFTKPVPHLYPHQWSWDSAFIALAYAHYDQDQARRGGAPRALCRSMDQRFAAPYRLQPHGERLFSRSRGLAHARTAPR